MKFQKRIWGVPGKMNTYYSPGKFMQEKRIVPLNANPLEAWDVKTSRYRRIDLVPRDNKVLQQGGVVPQDTTPIPQPTPSPTPTPSPVPLLWNTTNVEWENYNVNWENA